MRGNQGDAWTYDITNGQLMRKGNYNASFGDRCSQQDVIGAGIDVNAKVGVAVVPKQTVH